MARCIHVASSWHLGRCCHHVIEVVRRLERIQCERQNGSQELAQRQKPDPNNVYKQQGGKGRSADEVPSWHRSNIGFFSKPQNSRQLQSIAQHLSVGSRIKFAGIRLVWFWNESWISIIRYSQLPNSKYLWMVPQHPVSQSLTPLLYDIVWHQISNKESIHSAGFHISAASSYFIRANHPKLPLICRATRKPLLACALDLNLLKGFGNGPAIHAGGDKWKAKGPQRSKLEASMLSLTKYIWRQRSAIRIRSVETEVDLIIIYLVHWDFLSQFA